MKNYLFLIVLLVLGFSCTDYPQNLKIVPGTVEASLDSINGVSVLRGPSVLLDENKMVWGASVLKGDDGMYHMVFSTWNGGPDSLTFGNSWVLRSELGYAVSKYPDRDFQYQKIILRGRRYDGDSTAWDAQMAHNPHLKRFNGKYYLYYGASRDPGVQAKGSPGENLNKRNRVQQIQKIGVIEFESFSDLLNGNFKRPNKPLLTARTRVKKNNVVDPSPEGTEAKPDNLIVVNPSVTYRPSDKKYLLFFKGNWYDPVWRGVHGVAVSDSPMGPFETRDEVIFDIKMPDGKIANAEDPYVWHHKKHDCFYAIVKDFSGRLTGSDPGLALLKSIDGIKWELPENSSFLKKELTLANGTKLKVKHLERPQLLLDKKGNPIVFYGACAIHSPFDKKNHGTFNVHIPLLLELGE